MPLEFNIEVFDPKKEVLQKLVESVKNITADPAKITKEELAIVSDTRKTLMRHRTNIMKAGKATRDEALKFQRDVIAYEKELIGIIEPEELRLKDIEDKTKEYAIREVRREKLPELWARIIDVLGEEAVDHREDIEAKILEMDPNEFEAYYNEEVAAKNERDRLAQEEKEKVAEEQKEKEEAEQKEKEEEAAAKVKEEQEAKQKELDEKQVKNPKGPNHTPKRRSKTLAQLSSHWTPFPRNYFQKK